MNTVKDRLKAVQIVPIINVDKAEDILPLGRILSDNGLRVVEIALHSNTAVSAIKLLKKAQPEMLIGAGAVLTCEQITQAKKAGADYIVSPGFNPNIVHACQWLNMEIIPGVNNPSSVEAALEMGLTILNFYPAEASGGINMVKSLVTPYKKIELMPTGGINTDNLKEYLAIPQVFACGGTWMVNQNLINEGKWDEVANLSRKIVEKLSNKVASLA